MLTHVALQVWNKCGDSLCITPSELHLLRFNFAFFKIRACSRLGQVIYGLNIRSIFLGSRVGTCRIGGGLLTHTAWLGVLVTFVGLKSEYVYSSALCIQAT